jgi:hypothetical protein
MVLRFKGVLARDNDCLFLSAARPEAGFPTLILDLTADPHVDLLWVRLYRPIFPLTGWIF